jgi:NhaP-type Na+/H+ or K+/H+ antiporter
MKVNMKMQWTLYLIAILTNFVLSLFDYLSATLGFSFFLPIAMVILTLALAISIVWKSPKKKRDAILVLILFLVGHYQIAGMLFAMIIWKINGFAP